MPRVSFAVEGPARRVVRPPGALRANVTRGRARRCARFFSRGRRPTGPPRMDSAKRAYGVSPVDFCDSWRLGVMTEFIGRPRRRWKG